MEKVTNKINDNEKITDKAFSHAILTSFFAIIFCIICLCATTYAWFTTTTGSDSNVIEAGRFVADVNVEYDDSVNVTVTVNEQGVASCTLAPNKLYTVTLDISDTSTLTKGHCIVNIKGTNYGTDGIYSDSTVPLSFKIDTTEASDEVDVKFTSVWGVLTSPMINKDTKVVITDGSIVLE